jgi:hypothetical protein
MKKSITLLAMFLAFAFATQAQTSDEKKDVKKEDSKKKKKGPLPLDNMTFTCEVTTTSNGKTGKGKPDEISFKGGKMKSNFLDEKNSWGGISYVVTADSLDADEDKYIIFEAIQEDKEKDESIKINGTVIADNIEATAVWIKKEKTKAEYTFTGTVKKKK